jgi:hypothetical protein
MKQAMIETMKNEVNDEYYTPPEAIQPLLQFLNYHATFYDPCTPPNGVNNIQMYLTEKHLNAKAAPAGKDFLTTTRAEISAIAPTSPVIVTNPPFSRKDEFLDHAYYLGFPFAMLLPITALEGVERGKMFKQHGLQLLVLNRRINFIPGKSCYFNSSWFCWKLLHHDLIFADVNPKQEDLF